MGGEKSMYVPEDTGDRYSRVVSHVTCYIICNKKKKKKNGLIVF